MESLMRRRRARVDERLSEEGCAIERPADIVRADAGCSRRVCFDFRGLLVLM
jgi:hypothetical protein